MQPREPFLLLLFLAQLHSLIQCPLCIIVFALSSAISNQSIELCISINLLFPNAYGEGNFHWCHALYFQRKTSFRPCNVPNWKIFIVNSLLKCIVKKSTNRRVWSHVLNIFVCLRTHITTHKQHTHNVHTNISWWKAWIKSICRQTNPSLYGVIWTSPSLVFAQWIKISA